MPPDQEFSIAVCNILGQLDDAGAFHPVASKSSRLTQPERSYYPPNILEVLRRVVWKSRAPTLLK